MMLIPGKGLWFKWVVLLWALVAVIWMILEGGLELTVFLGLSTSLLMLFALVRKVHAKWPQVLDRSVPALGFLGFLCGLATVLMTLFLMAFKTGLHAHGPEYTMGEIAWVIDQTLLWAVSGLMVGVGLGLLLKAFSKT